ncbi:MAG TPA: hypothetical protein VGS22_19645 [Thermoanaerobaculia bacterium]|jgi:hypothetical protein|nr:hypothetical protein [Thermoanaerobaculia bacterium]
MNGGASSDDRAAESLWAALIGDGRPLLSLTGLALILSGGFMLFLSVTGSFLPHDIAYLGMDASALCNLAQCRVVHFMFHDRVSFGGVLIAIGTLYLWLAEFPLRRGEEWAWWVFAASGATGFASFLSYLGYGYLDTWHGTATLALLPLYLLGMWRTRRLLTTEPRRGWRSLRSPGRSLEWRTRAGIGRTLLLFSGLGMTLAGSVITAVGMTTVFVPEDLAYMGLSASQIGEISSRLLPLIAHDRAGFGGGLLSCGVTVFLIVWKAPLTRALWQALLLSGLAGFACAIGIHYRIGYLIFTHLAPAWAGALLYAAGMVFLWRRWPRVGA